MSDSDNDFAQYRGVYDGQGNHRYGLLPPLMVDNVLTEDFHLSKAKRPVTEWISLRDWSEQPELGLVYMVPLGLKPGDAVPPEIIAMAVHLIENDKAVMIHADNPDTALSLKAITVAFLGGGHA